MKVSKLLLLILLLAFILSCGSQPKTGTVEPAPTPPPPAVVQNPPPSAAFDPGNVSQQHKQNTKEEVQKFIGELNTIIKAKNFNRWKAALSDEYFNKISSADFLREMSEQPLLKLNKIVLRNVQDYFTNVVVPSRTRTQAEEIVDEIVFISEYRVTAYRLAPDGTRLRLYDLEHEGNNWKIIN